MTAGGCEVNLGAIGVECDADWVSCENVDGDVNTWAVSNDHGGCHGAPWFVCAGRGRDGQLAWCTDVDPERTKNADNRR